MYKTITSLFVAGMVFLGGCQCSREFSNNRECRNLTAELYKLENKVAYPFEFSTSSSIDNWYHSKVPQLFPAEIKRMNELETRLNKLNCNPHKNSTVKYVKSFSDKD